MNHSGAVSSFEALADLCAISQNLLQRQCTLAEAAREGFAFEKLHDEIIRPVLMSDIVEGADIGMVQR